MHRLFAPTAGRRELARRLACILSLAVLPTVASTAAAELNVVVCNAPGDQTTPRMISDGDGGALVVWVDRRSGEADIYAQHVLGSLALDPAWPPQGVALCTAPGPQSNPRLVSDGAGGAIVAWVDARSGNSDVFAHRLLASGAADPAWPPEGLAVASTPYEELNPSLDSDGGSGAIVAWQDERNGWMQPDCCVQHVLGSGAADPAWPPEGVFLAAASFPHVVADGHGGAIIVCSSLAPNSARHVLAAGVEDPTWRPADFSGSVLPDFLAVASDEAGGAYVLVLGGGDTAFRHLLASGTLGPANYWPHWWRSVDPGEPAMAADDAGGAVAAFAEPPPESPMGMQQQGIYAQIVRPTGEILEWLLPRAEYPLSSWVYTREPCVAPDAVGGMYVAWTDERESARHGIYLQHVMSTGGADPMCPPRGRLVSAWTAHAARAPQIVTDGLGGAIVAWEGGGDWGSSRDICATRVLWDVPTAALISLVSSHATAERARLEWRWDAGAGLPVSFHRRTESSDWQRIGGAVAGGDGQIVLLDRDVAPGARYGYRLGIVEERGDSHLGEAWVTIPPRFELALGGLRPNPAGADAAVAFTLPDDRDASLELVDVNGRRVVEQRLGAPGPGHHVVGLAAARSLPAGLYFMSLHHRGRTLTARAVIVK